MSADASDGTLTTHGLRSADGSRIGYEIHGRGPVLVAVHGASADRQRWAAVLKPLAARYAVVAMDRRGRGLSREEAGGAYSIDREAEDVRAVIAAARRLQDGAPVFVLGHSYGALCALEAARDNADIARLLVYEPAFSTPGHDVIGPVPLAHLARLIDAGTLDAALEFFFLEIVHVPPRMVAAMRLLPTWAQRLEAVHTLVREGREANAWTPQRLGRLTMPVRLLVGGVTSPWLRASTLAAHAALPGSELVELPGQGHGAMDTAPALFVAEVSAWFDAAASVPA